MDAYEQGFNLFKQEPELLLIEVAHRAPDRKNGGIEYHDFVRGYQDARRQHDDFLREHNP